MTEKILKVHEERIANLERIVLATHGTLNAEAIERGWAETRKRVKELNETAPRFSSQGQSVAPEEEAFEAPCRFGGTCTDKKLYENCVKDERVKNNWMCWRDGILKRDDVPKEFKGAKP